MRWSKIGLAVAGILASSLWFGTASATAIPANLAVDFRGSAWSGAHGETSFTDPSSGITASASCIIFRCKLSHDSVDGLGVKHFLDTDPEEVDLTEEIHISFGPAGRMLTGVWITDLYDTPDGGDNGEDGQVFLDLVIGDTTFTFNGTLSDQANGELFVSFGGALLVTDAYFRAVNGPEWYEFGNDFSVAGFTAVPEPATLALVGAGLLGLGLLRRRRAA